MMRLGTVLDVLAPDVAVRELIRDVGGVTLPLEEAVGLARLMRDAAAANREQEAIEANLGAILAKGQCQCAVCLEAKGE